VGPVVRVKHIPRRTCVACQQESAKRALIRLVRASDGRVEIDPTGKKPGRGAYLCAASECWARGLARGHLARALRATLSEDERATLAEYGRGLPPLEEPARPVGAPAD
jgi:predicted RNA-binding protein YlxR (DUF448 family)